MDAKIILTHLIKAGRDSLHLEETLRQIGYNGTPYFNLHGEICEAVYNFLGEDVESFDQSATHAAMHDFLTSDEQCAEHLASMISEPDKGIDIPDSAKDMLIEAAERRHMDLPKLIKLILCEWAANEIMLNQRISAI